LGNNASLDAYARFIRPALFRLDPERVHGLTLQALGLIGRFPPGRYALKKRFSLEDSRLKRRVFGLEFPNPVGLAAGYEGRSHPCPSRATRARAFSGCRMTRA